MSTYIDYATSPNEVARYLQKEPGDFTREDIVRYIDENDIEMINFRYPGADGRLKTLNFVINNEEHLDSILSCGERVDGSSLFPYIEAGESDLYVLPRYRTAFLNPFSTVPALDMLCSFYGKDGKPMEMSPEYTMRKAHEALREVTGMEFEVMGELEYYVVSEAEADFRAPDQRGYHESSPFCKKQELREIAMKYIAAAGGLIKYGHSEVGNFILGDRCYEQNEIEFLPTRMEEAADQLLIAKWILRELAFRHGVDITFAPKITAGKAGSGMHVHTRLTRDGKNVLVKDGELSAEAMKAIAGYLNLAPSLTAFGNTNPMSYLRLVPHQEAPTSICWGDRNRSVLVRVPLGWRSGVSDMARDANPLEPVENRDYSGKQTVEFRCPDGSADVYLLMAGLAVAARHGFEMENAEGYARDRYVGVNIFDEAHRAVADGLSHLPTSCHESAECLDRQRAVYEERGVFAPGLIDGLIAGLRKYDDACLREEIERGEVEVEELVEEFYHCG